MSSYLEAAYIKITTKEDIDQSNIGTVLDILPKNQETKDWETIQVQYKLTMLELLALKDHICEGLFLFNVNHIIIYHTKTIKDNYQRIKKIKFEEISEIIDITVLREDSVFPPLEKDAVIDLSNFQIILSNNNFCNVELKEMFIREEYLLALNKWDKSDSGFILMGSPGIGKSTFGKLLLCRLLSQDEKVIYWHSNEDYPLLFEGTIGRRITKSRMGNLSDTIVIYDHEKGFHSELGERNIKKMLIIHSPSADINNSAKSLNLNGKKWLMNSSTFQECEMICEKLKWKISAEKLKENFSICGGILRYLVYDTDVLHEAVMEGCYKVCLLDFTIIANFNLLPDTSDKLCHRVIHHRRVDDNKNQLEFGSEFIEETILREKSRDNDFGLMRIANAIDINGSFRGEIFENRMHYNLSENFALKFNTKSLLLKPDSSKSISVSVDICLTKKHSFIKLSNIQQVDLDTYYYPKDKRICLKSIDSFFLFRNTMKNNLLTLVLFQMTVAKSHPVKRQGLIDIINLVKKDNTDFNTLLVFLTPPVVFDQWIVEQKGPDENLNLDGSVSKTIICNQEVWCLEERNGFNIWNN